MSDVAEAKREPWLVLLMKGQISNKAAEALGKGPWVLWVVTLFATTMLAAFPFVNDKFSSAMKSTNPALYPGLGAVFSEIRDKGWSLTVEKTGLVAGPGVPAQTRVGQWLVVFEPAGGTAQALQDAVGTSGTTVQKVAFFGKTHFGLIDQETQAQFDGTWEKMVGFRSEDLQKLSVDKFLPIVLYATATGGMIPAIYTLILLMFVQVTFLIVVLGFLLSLSKVHIAGTALGAKRGVGFLASLKTVGFVALGPALAVCLGLVFLPGASGISWVALTLLFGGRVVFLYMARFRNKKRKE